ncbi:DgyrCDS13467 [Dimorphilus gyrociliatus]|uniref:DgyrCDS13467 n=1 Tax=Dimorphilus gyrociliatus TaxID=2664684 RepID=A0A7I8WAU8_9ANNE|nr:DgyrCDS13467 [Dimorphilus gyrociliatus]
MFGTKRLAKRSIVGTKVCAPGQDGRFYAGVINSTKTGPRDEDLYVIKFDDGILRTYDEKNIYGGGFQSITSCQLPEGQQVYITYNGRELCGTVDSHDDDNQVLISCILPDSTTIQIQRRLEEVRLLRSRKSARLLDQDKDYCRLADVHSESKRRAVSSSIDVPAKQRRGSEEIMDEEQAAMVLTSLSCSPKLSSSYQDNSGSVSSGVFSMPSESPPSLLSTSAPPNLQDDMIDTMSSSSNEEDEMKGTRTVFQCTWRNCEKIMSTRIMIEKHIRQEHLGRGADEDWSDHEEDFYYNEIEVSVDTVTDQLADMHTYSTSPPSSFVEQSRIFIQDHDYQRKDHPIRPSKSPRSSNTHLASSFPTSGYQNGNSGLSRSYTWGSNSKPYKSLYSTAKLLPMHKKSRSDVKKCRKVYGMENRDMWCTQCKWKKACSRFTD